MIKKNGNFEQISVQDTLKITPKKSVIGNLSVNAYRKGKLEGSKNLGENLAVNNSKMIMTHLISQTTSGVAGTMSKILAFDPRNWSETNGGIPGNVTIDGSSFNPTATQLKLSYMAFGTNEYGGSYGPSADVEQWGLFNAVSKGGYTADSGTDYTVSNYFYGGGTSVTYQFLRTADPGLVDNGIVRIIVRMATTEGQPTDGQIEYREAGLFTTSFYSHTAGSGGAQNCPFMFARKVFSPITKTDDLELEFVWELRF